MLDRKLLAAIHLFPSQREECTSRPPPSCSVPLLDDLKFSDWTEGFVAFGALFSIFPFIIVNIFWFYRNLFAYWKLQFIASFNGDGCEKAFQFIFDCNFRTHFRRHRHQRTVQEPRREGRLMQFHRRSLQLKLQLMTRRTLTDRRWNLVNSWCLQIKSFLIAGVTWNSR